MFNDQATAIKFIQKTLEKSSNKVRFHHGFKEPVVQGKKVFQITNDTITLGHDTIPLTLLSVAELEHLYNAINDYNEFKRYNLEYKEIYY